MEIKVSNESFADKIKRRDPSILAQQLIQRPVSTEELYQRMQEGDVKPVPMPQIESETTAVPMPEKETTDKSGDDSFKVDISETLNTMRGEGTKPYYAEMIPTTDKSMSGFLGPVKSKTGRTMTEFSIDLNVKQPDGSVEEMRVPSLVPGLTQSDVDLLAKDEELMEASEEERMAFREKNKEQFQKIFNTASKHAEDRLAKGKSVYYQDSEPTSAITEGVKLDEEPIQEKLIYDDRLTSDDTTKPKAEALSNEEFINDWGKTYQTDNDPVKNKAALKRLDSFDGEIKPEATTAMIVAGAIFDGDKNVTSDQIIDYLTKVGIVESNFSTKKQKGNGPARSYWQVEPATALDLSKNSRAFFGNKFNTAFKKYAKDGETAIETLSKMSKEEISKLLLDDDRLAASFAAAKYIATR